MRVAVIGANGQLGTDVCLAFREAGDDVVSLTRDDLDIRDGDAVMRVLSRCRPDVVVNTAAMHNLEACEADPGTARAVNTDGAQHLATAGASLGFKLAHVSTDYVFDGRKTEPYVETDVAAPLNVYGRTKLEGERRVLDTLPASFVVRTSGLYGNAPCRAKPQGSFVNLMLRLGRERGEVRVVTDEMVTPTCTADLARQIVRMARHGCRGVYHATSQGETSWFDYALAIFELSGMEVRVHPAGAGDFPMKTPRPAYSVLRNAALEREGIDLMPPWKDALARHLRSSR